MISAVGDSATAILQPRHKCSQLLDIQSLGFAGYGSLAISAPFIGEKK